MQIISHPSDNFPTQVSIVSRVVDYLGDDYRPSHAGPTIQMNRHFLMSSETLRSRGHATALLIMPPRVFGR